MLIGNSIFAISTYSGLIQSQYTLVLIAGYNSNRTAPRMDLRHNHPPYFPLKYRVRLKHKEM